MLKISEENTVDVLGLFIKHVFQAAANCLEKRLYSSINVGSPSSTLQLSYLSASAVDAIVQSLQNDSPLTKSHLQSSDLITGEYEGEKL